EPPDEISRGEIVMTRDRDELPPEVVGHRLDEARLATAGRALQQDRQPLPVRGTEDLLLVPYRHVVRPRRRHAVLFSIRNRSRVRCVRCQARRRRSTDRSADRNSGPTTPGSCSSRGIRAWADVPKTRRSTSGSVLAAMLRQTQAVPRRRASANARRASASPYTPSSPWSY